MNCSKKFFLISLIATALFAGCAMNSDPGIPGDPVTPLNPRTYPDDKNPTISSKASTSLDYIFSLSSIGHTKITIRRSEWNKMLSYYDYFYKNENNVIAESYEYEKDGQTWSLKEVGLRLRGNTSRFRPQGKDDPYDEVGNRQMNADWSQDYYNYAATCSDNDYRQSHFKIDFEPYSNDDRKMSNCMKGVALKRPDNYFSKEIFCYYLFHQYGIWTAPRASETTVEIIFKEDIDTNGAKIEDLSSCSETKVRFGVYEMFEEVNKQSLKARSKSNSNNSADNAWANNNGDLWKCCGDLTISGSTPDRFGVEQIEILNTDKPKSQWSHVWNSYKYDLKTNKTNLAAARNTFLTFIRELDALKSTDADTPAGINARKAFYEKWFDVDFFIKSYAVNMLLGMDDDYWGNANNYYLYFGKNSEGITKCYFIPFDYDNTLGSSITGDKVYTDPFKWGYKDGEKKDRPLMDRLLEVPEYRLKMRDALLLVSSQASDSPWNRDKCIAWWLKIKEQVDPFTAEADLTGWPNKAELSFYDSGSWKQDKHYMLQIQDNLYEQVSNSFEYWLKDDWDRTISFDPNGGKFVLNNNVITDPLVKEYDIDSLDLNKILGTEPIRENHIFLGWTKTKNGTDYQTRYMGESGLKLYASWKEITDTASIDQYLDFWGNLNHIKINIQATTNGLVMTTDKLSNGANVDVELIDETASNLSIIGINEFHRNNRNDASQSTTLLYPYVEAGHIYNIKFVYDYNDTNSVSTKVKATGGKGNLYFNFDSYTYNTADNSVTFTNLKQNIIPCPGGTNLNPNFTDRNDNHRVYMFSDGLWNSSNPENVNWGLRWKFIEGSSNTIKFYNQGTWSGDPPDCNLDSGIESWSSDKAHLSMYVGYEIDEETAPGNRIHLRKYFFDKTIR